MVVHPGLPAKSVKEFIALARAKPQSLNMASAGIGASSHLAGIMFMNLSGIETVHVPYKGGGPMAAAVVAGRGAMGDRPGGGADGTHQGRTDEGAGDFLRVALAAACPNLPTIAEAGVPGYEYTSWNGIFAPKGTPRAIIAKLHATTQKALADAGREAALRQPGPRAAGQREPGGIRKVLPSGFRPHGEAGEGGGHQA